MKLYGLRRLTNIHLVFHWCRGFIFSFFFTAYPSLSIYFKEGRRNKDKQKHRLKLEWTNPGKPGTKREENLYFTTWNWRARPLQGFHDHVYTPNSPIYIFPPSFGITSCSSPSLQATSNSACSKWLCHLLPP